MELKKVQLYLGYFNEKNPGKSTYTYILKYKEHTKIESFIEDECTFYQAEMKALIKGLSALKQKCAVTIYIRNVYVLHGIKHWLKKWKKNNWLKTNNKPILNEDLWREIDQLCSEHEIDVKCAKEYLHKPIIHEVSELAYRTYLKGG